MRLIARAALVVAASLVATSTLSAQTSFSIAAGATMIVSFDCSGSFDLQLSNTGFDRSLVDTDNIVMRVLESECFGQRSDQVFLVELRISFDGLMLNTFCDLT